MSSVVVASQSAFAAAQLLQRAQARRRHFSLRRTSRGTDSRSAGDIPVRPPMKTLILTAMLALTAVSGVVVTSQPAAAYNGCVGR